MEKLAKLEKFVVSTQNVVIMQDWGVIYRYCDSWSDIFFNCLMKLFYECMYVPVMWMMN